MSQALAAPNMQRNPHSPGLMAGVVLAHAAVVTLLLMAAPSTIERVTPPRPLNISLIEHQEEVPKPEVKPEPRKPQIKPAPPKPVTKPAPVPPVLNIEKTVAQELPRAIPVTEARPVIEPVPEVLPPPAPVMAEAPRVAPFVTEAPRPAPPAPPPIIEPRFDADYLDNPKPPYPTLSRKLGETGKVFLRVLVKVDGTVKDIELHRSSGFERLDRSAMNTVQTWRFVPARQGNKPVDGWVIVPINFTFGS